MRSEVTHCISLIMWIIDSNSVSMQNLISITYKRDYTKYLKGADIEYLKHY